MTDPAWERICTLCRTRFTPARGMAWSTVGSGYVLLIGVLVVAAAVRPGPLLAGGLCVAYAVGHGWAARRLAVARERTCTSCGSQETVPLLSPAGIDLDCEEVR